MATAPLSVLCQDFLIIQNLTTPGICVVRNAGSPRKIDEQAGTGQDGARTLYMGRKLARPEIDIHIWSAEHLIEWEPIGVLLAPPPFGIPPRALSIYHPQLTAPPSSITAVLCEDAGMWDEDDQGGWKRTIKLVEYRPPRAMLAQPTPAIPGSPEVPAPRDALGVQIDALSAQVTVAQVRPPGT